MVASLQSVGLQSWARRARVPELTVQSWAAPADAKQSARAVREFMSEVHAWVMLRLTTQLDTSRFGPAPARLPPLLPRLPLLLLLPPRRRRYHGDRQLSRPHALRCERCIALLPHRCSAGRDKLLLIRLEMELCLEDLVVAPLCVPRVPGVPPEYCKYPEYREYPVVPCVPRQSAAHTVGHRCRLQRRHRRL